MTPEMLLLNLMISIIGSFIASIIMTWLNRHEQP